MGAIPELRPAATVILVRDRQGGPYEIFLMRRHRNQAFMGGAYVFPGGRLDEGDSHPDLLAHLHGLAPEALPERLQEPALPPETALGLHLTAIREMFEPPAFFEQLGVHYLGPYDGHDIAAVETALRAAKDLDEPVVVHVPSRGGAGCPPESPRVAGHPATRGGPVSRA